MLLLQLFCFRILLLVQQDMDEIREEVLQRLFRSVVILFLSYGALERGSCLLVLVLLPGAAVRRRECPL